jgi:hypothetical protein
MHEDHANASAPTIAAAVASSCVQAALPNSPGSLSRSPLSALFRLHPNSDLTRYRLLVALGHALPGERRGRFFYDGQLIGCRMVRAETFIGGSSV